MSHASSTTDPSLQRIFEWRRELERRLGYRVEINEEVLEKVKRNNYMCLCKFKTKCPCPASFYEIQKFGRCKCELYYDPTRYNPHIRRGLRIDLQKRKHISAGTNREQAANRQRAERRR